MNETDLSTHIQKLTTLSCLMLTNRVSINGACHCTCHHHAEDMTSVWSSAHAAVGDVLYQCLFVCAYMLSGDRLRA